MRTIEQIDAEIEALEKERDALQSTRSKARAAAVLDAAIDSAWRVNAVLEKALSAGEEEAQ